MKKEFTIWVHHTIEGWQKHSISFPHENIAVEQVAYMQTNPHKYFIGGHVPSIQIRDEKGQTFHHFAEFCPVRGLIQNQVFKKY